MELLIVEHRVCEIFGKKIISAEGKKVTPIYFVFSLISLSIINCPNS
jgi:hypothetical protein